MSTMLPHDKYTRPRIRIPVLELMILLSMKFLFSSWGSYRVRVADFSVGLWLGFGWGYFSLVRVREGIFQFGYG